MHRAIYIRILNYSNSHRGRFIVWSLFLRQYRPGAAISRCPAPFRGSRGGVEGGGHHICNSTGRPYTEGLVIVSVCGRPVNRLGYIASTTMPVLDLRSGCYSVQRSQGVGRYQNTKLARARNASSHFTRFESLHFYRFCIPDTWWISNIKEW